MSARRVFTTSRNGTASPNKTSSCYLDGRYVNVALADVDEFIPQPIVAEIVFDVNGKLLSEVISSEPIELNEGMNIARVVVRSTYMLHSALLWIDTSRSVAWLTDTVRDGNNAHDAAAKSTAYSHMEKARTALYRMMEQYVAALVGYTFTVERIIVPDTKQTGCKQHGYCNSYVIKQVLDYVAGKEFDSNVDILQFTAMIEDTYGDKLDATQPPEVEYFFGVGAGLGLGLIGGVALGAALASSSTNRRGW